MSPSETLAASASRTVPNYVTHTRAGQFRNDRNSILFDSLAHC